MLDRFGYLFLNTVISFTHLMAFTEARREAVDGVAGAIFGGQAQLPGNTLSTRGDARVRLILPMRMTEAAALAGW
mgnify:CR=1 FL=1